MIDVLLKSCAEHGDKRDRGDDDDDDDDDDEFRTMQLGRTMALIRELGENHRETWLGGAHDHASLGRAMSFTNQVII